MSHISTWRVGPPNISTSQTGLHGGKLGVKSRGASQHARKPTTRHAARTRSAAARHAAGLRYRVDSPPLPDQRRLRADLVFTRAKVAVFVDGCFWHGCPQHHTVAKSNADFWAAKVAGNRARDERVNAKLAAAAGRCSGSGSTTTQPRPQRGSSRRFGVR